MKILRYKYYWICPRCKAALDPEEACDCCKAEAGNKNGKERNNKNGKRKNQGAVRPAEQVSGSY